MEKHPLSSHILDVKQSKTLTMMQRKIKDPPAVHNQRGKRFKNKTSADPISAPSTTVDKPNTNEIETREEGLSNEGQGCANLTVEHATKVENGEIPPPVGEDVIKEIPVSTVEEDHKALGPHDSDVVPTVRDNDSQENAIDMPLDQQYAGGPEYAVENEKIKDVQADKGDIGLYEGDHPSTGDTEALRRPYGKENATLESVKDYPEGKNVPDGDIEENAFDDTDEDTSIDSRGEKAFNEENDLNTAELSPRVSRNDVNDRSLDTFDGDTHKIHNAKLADNDTENSLYNICSNVAKANISNETKCCDAGDDVKGQDVVDDDNSHVNNPASTSDTEKAEVDIEDNENGLTEDGIADIDDRNKDGSAFNTDHNPSAAFVENADVHCEMNKDNFQQTDVSFNGNKVSRVKDEDSSERDLDAERHTLQDHHEIDGRYDNRKTDTCATVVVYVEGTDKDEGGSGEVKNSTDSVVDDNSDGNTTKEVYVSKEENFPDTANQHDLASLTDGRLERLDRNDGDDTSGKETSPSSTEIHLGIHSETQTQDVSRKENDPESDINVISGSLEEKEISSGIVDEDKLIRCRKIKVENRTERDDSGKLQRAYDQDTYGKSFEHDICKEDYISYSEGHIDYVMDNDEVRIVRHLEDDEADNDKDGNLHIASDLTYYNEKCSHSSKNLQDADMNYVHSHLVQEIDDRSHGVKSPSLKREVKSETEQVKNEKGESRDEDGLCKFHGEVPERREENNLDLAKDGKIANQMIMEVNNVNDKENTCTTIDTSENNKCWLRH